MSGRKRIMVVDDDERITDLLSEFCSDLGYEVKCVNRSPEAVGVAAEWRPHLITLDIEMPEMDGTEVLKSLRSDPATRDIPVLIISVLAKEGVIAPSAVQGLFSKPVKFSHLMGQIDQLLQPVGV